MDAASRFPERLGLAVLTKSHLADVRKLLEMPPDGREAPEADRIRFLPDLVSLEIPRLALGIEEIVRLRTDGLFEDLRQGLTEALRRTASLTEDDVVDPASVRVREIREYLDDVAATSVQSTTRSRVFRTATTGSIALGDGCAGIRWRRRARSCRRGGRISGRSRRGLARR
jgi:hypothetical protein